MQQTLDLFPVSASAFQAPPDRIEKDLLILFVLPYAEYVSRDQHAQPALADESCVAADLVYLYFAARRMLYKLIFISLLPLSGYPLVLPVYRFQSTDESISSTLANPVKPMVNASSCRIFST